MRKAFEAFVERYTGRDMAYHRRYGTTGLEFAYECWKEGAKMRFESQGQFNVNGEIHERHISLNAGGIAQQVPAARTELTRIAIAFADNVCALLYPESCKAVFLHLTLDGDSFEGSFLVIGPSGEQPLAVIIAGVETWMNWGENIPLLLGHAAAGVLVAFIVFWLPLRAMKYIFTGR